MPIDIRNIVKTDFNIIPRITPIGSYKNVLYVTNATTSTTGSSASVGVITVATATFANKVNNVYDTPFEFVYASSGSTWTIGGTSLSVAELGTQYGITYTGTPSNNDKIIVTLTGGSTLSVAKNIYEALKCDKNDVLMLAANTVSNLSKAILDEKKRVSGTEDDFIFVVFDPAISVSAALVQSLAGFVSPYKVIPCVSISIDSADLAATLTSYTPYPVAVKIVNASDAAAPLGMCIAAYYSKINLDNLYEVQDYCYTDESAVFDETGEDLNKYALVNISQTNYDAYANVANFTDIVGNSIVNFGGNLTNGVSITAYFGTIASDNDIMFAVLRTMLNKQYLTAEGLNNVVAAINGALERYTRNGYLEQNSRYGGTTYIENYNGTSNVMIKENALLPSGYYVAAVPISRISVADRKAHKFTPIRVFMQTQAGARVVEIDGTIIE